MEDQALPMHAEETAAGRMCVERAMEAGSNMELLALWLNIASITLHLRLSVTTLIGSTNTSLPKVIRKDS